MYNALWAYFRLVFCCIVECQFLKHACVHVYMYMYIHEITSPICYRHIRFCCWQYYRLTCTQSHPPLMQFDSVPLGLVWTLVHSCPIVQIQQSYHSFRLLQLLSLTSWLSTSHVTIWGKGGGAELHVHVALLVAIVNAYSVPQTGTVIRTISIQRFIRLTSCNKLF